MSQHFCKLLGDIDTQQLTERLCLSVRIRLPSFNYEILIIVIIIIIITIFIIIIVIINCNWFVTRSQWLFYMYTKYEIGY